MPSRSAAVYGRSSFPVKQRSARAPALVYAGACPTEKKRKSVLPIDELIADLLLVAAFVLIQALIGGTRPIFSLPSYALLAVIGWLGIFWLRRAKPNPNQLCLASSTLFFGYILVRAFFSPVGYLARTDIYSVLAGLIVYLFVVCVFTSSKHRVAFLLFLLAIAMAHILVGAIQFRGGQNFMPISFLQRHDYGPRASGFYVCPNHLAGLLEVVGVFGLSIVCWSRWPTWSKLLIGYATCACYLGLALTGSRGGYLSVGFSLLVFATLSSLTLRRAGGRLFWIAGGAALIAVILIGASAICLFQKSDYLSDRAQAIVDKSNVRIDLWSAALEQWKLRPIIGTGGGTYLYYGRQFRTERIQHDPVYVHNDYLQLLAEYGLTGVLLLAIFLATHLRNGWRNFQHFGPKRVAHSSHVLSNTFALNLGALAAICAYVVHSFVDFNLHVPANVLLVAFVFGLVASAVPGRERSVARETSLLTWRLVLPALGTVMAIQCVLLLPAEYFAERARTALRDDQPDQAADFSLRGLKTEHGNPNLFQYLGSARSQQAALLQNGHERSLHYDAAIEAFGAARALFPEDENITLALASIYDAVGRFSEAEWLYEKALRLDPKLKYIKQAYANHLDQWRVGQVSVQPEGGAAHVAMQ